MAKHFNVVIKVAYDVASHIPEDMSAQLVNNVRRCIENAELLNDADLEAIVDDWSVEVEEVVQ